MIKVAFVQNLAFEYLGIMTLASRIKAAGHEAEVFILQSSFKRSLREIVRYDPNLVAFSITTGNHIWAVNFAERLKAIRPTLTIFGGPHPTFFPEFINEKSVDIICRGEGDLALVGMCNNMRDGLEYERTPNCSFKRNGKIIVNPLGRLINDLDTLPTPDRTIYRRKYKYLRKSTASFMAGRGCPYKCSFCFNNAAQALYAGLGQYVRLRSPENLVEEMAKAASELKLRTIYLQDDTILLSKKWIRKFSELYRQRVALPLVCLLRADQVDEASIVQLKAAGLKNVFFGVETGEEALRNSLLKKGITNNQIRNAAKILKRHKIRFRTYNMVGLPTETLDHAFETLKLNQEIKTDYPWCSIFFPFPGTELAQIASKITTSRDIPYHVYTPSFFKRSILKTPDADSFGNLQKLFFYGVRFPVLTSLLKRIVQYSPNRFFDMLFLLSYGFCLWRSENLTISDVFSTGFRNLRRFFYSSDELDSR